MGFRVLVSLHPAIQATGRLTFAPAGLIPAEHTSLRWTHKQTQFSSTTIYSGRSPVPAELCVDRVDGWVRQLAAHFYERIAEDFSADAARSDAAAAMPA